MTDFSGDLGLALADLGADLALPDVDLVGSVRAEISTDPGRHDRAPRPLLVAAAVLLLVAVVSVLAIAPARTAVANWLGIGATSVGVVEDLPPAYPPTLPTTTVDEKPPDPDSVRAAAAAQLSFVPKLPDPVLAGPVVAWEVRHESGAPELIVVFDDFILTERATDETSIIARKFTESADAIAFPVTAAGTETLWVEGIHVRVLGDTSELTESALIWVDDGVELRVSGPLDLDTALALADSFS